MKIVLPFLINDENDLDSPRVSGGLERFSQFIYQYADAEVLPFYYTRKDRKKLNVTSKLHAFIVNHRPDIVISNQDSGTITTNLQKLIDIPILWISHTASGGIFKIPQLDMMKEFVDAGGTLAMVSRWQYDGMNKLSKRVKQRELELNGGFINSAFCSGKELASNQIDYDCITIGRVDKEKDPFVLHRLAGKSNLSSLVLTSAYDLIPSQQEYLGKNKHWEAPRYTMFNLKHTEVMDYLSRSGVYLSTCARETWGITALEAYARGVPVILFHLASNDYKHASEDIAPSPEFYAAITSRSEKAFKSAVDKLQTIDRMELSQKTKEKHSKENWILSLHNLIDKTIEIKKKHRKPVSWFD
jgi:hypothetical protein